MISVGRTVLINQNRTFYDPVLGCNSVVILMRCRLTTSPLVVGEHLARDVTGCAVKADACGVDVGITTIGPIDESRHRIQQGLA
jgi:hypothetical protein